MFVDDLYSTSTDMGLTANMGRQLREMIEEVISRVEELEASQIDLSNYVKKTELSTVATSGSYNDLKNKPTIPTVSNDLTDTLKAHYDSAYTHSQSTHAPSNAQANVLEKVKVNGVQQTISNKEVNITVPTAKTVIW